MALQKHIVELDFSGGRNAKIDPKLLPKGGLLELENAYQMRSGEVRKRLGYNAMTQAIKGQGPIATGRAVESLGNDLIVFDDIGGYSYSEDLDVYIKKGEYSPVSVALDKVTSMLRHDSNRRAELDVAVVNDLVFYVFRKDTTIGTGGIYLTVVDLHTGAEVFSETLISSTGILPRLVTFTDAVGILHRDTVATNEIKFTLVNTVSSSSISIVATATVVTDAAAWSGGVSQYDASDLDPVDGTDYYLAYKNTSNQLHVKQFNLNTTLNYNSLFTGVNPTTISVTGTSGGVWVNFYDSTNGGQALLLSGTLATTLGVTTTVGTALGTTKIKCAAGRTGTGSDDTIRFWFSEGSPSSTQQDRVATGTVTSGGTVSSISTINQVYAYSRPIRYSSTVQFICCSFREQAGGVSTGTLNGGCVIDQSGHVYSRYLDRTHPGPNDNPAVRWESLGSDKYLTAFTRSLDVSLRYNTIPSTATDIDLAGATFDFTPERHSSTLVNDVLYTTGGHLRGYDHSSLTEHGFHYAPGITSSSVSTSGSLTLPNGTYLFKVIYYWRDDEGNEHFSQPSADSSVTSVSLTGSNDNINLVLQTYRRTDKSDVAILVYRTTANGTNYHLDGFTANDTTVDTKAYAVLSDESQLISQPLLYTTGGVLPNDAPPYAWHISASEDRMFLVSGEDRKSLWVSKPVQPGVAPEFSSGLVIGVPDVGDIECVGSIDTRVVIFKTDSIYVLSGTGPNALGQGGYSGPDLVTSDTGCNNKNSLVRTPNGLAFSGTKGIYHIDRGLQVEYLGAPVEDFNSNTITSASLHKSLNQVRFATNDGTTLVWDYHHRSWGTFVGQSAVDAISYKSAWGYLASSGEFRQDSGYLDDAGGYSLRVRTPWIKVSALQGFQRVRRFAVLGEYQGTHTLRVRVYYDFDDSTVAETFTIDSSTVTSTVGAPFQIRRRLNRQKCNSIMLEIDDQDPAGDSLRLTGVSFEVATKTGVNRRAS